MCIQGLATVTGPQGTTVIQSQMSSLDTTLTQNNNSVFAYYITLSLCKTMLYKKTTHSMLTYFFLKKNGIKINN